MTLPDDLLEHIEAQSRRLNHFYLGAEHLFLALLSLPNSQLAAILDHLGHSPHYVAYRVENALGQSPDRRYWEGFRSTPRYEQILSLAARFDEYNLLLALLREQDNLPIRTMQKLGIDVGLLQALLETGLPQTQAQTFPTHFPHPLSLAAQDLWQKLIPEPSPQVQTLQDQELYALPSPYGYQLLQFQSPAQIMAAAERAEALPELAELARPKKLQVHPKTKLAAMLSYPLAQSAPLPILDYLQNNGFHLLGSLLKNDLFDPLKATFWGASQRYELHMWREYELILPPALVIRAEKLIPEDILLPLESWSYLDEVALGTGVELQNFTLQSLHPISKRLVLQAGYGQEAVYRASVVEVLGVENLATLQEGQPMPSLTGIVIATRASRLAELTAELNPPFDPLAMEIESPFGILINPLWALPHLLDYQTPANLSLIHGNLQLNSILLDTHARLLNFQDLRRGHVLFDWARLESSLLTDGLVSLLPNAEWDTVWESLSAASHPLQDGLKTLREIVKGLLDHPQDWREYLAPLTLVHLGYLQKRTASLGARRLAWAAAALAAEAFRQANQNLDNAL